MTMQGRQKNCSPKFYSLYIYGGPLNFVFTDPPNFNVVVSPLTMGWITWMAASKQHKAVNRPSATYFTRFIWWEEGRVISIYHVQVCSCPWEYSMEQHSSWSRTPFWLHTLADATHAPSGAAGQGVFSTSFIFSFPASWEISPFMHRLIRVIDWLWLCP